MILFATPTPTPVEMELWEVSPGLAGFFWGFFALAVLVIPLFWSMTRHMRTVERNARLREQEDRARDGDGGAAVGDTPAPERR